jgi:hypothetical protein
MADETLTVKAGATGGTSMRYHELAVQGWLNKLFFVRFGYPVPVVFASPMDAFSQFTNLWSQETNPFTYLLDLKDTQGTPLYEPFPSPVRYPVISVYRKGWKYRAYQNFSIHRWRSINWPTVSDTGSTIYGPVQNGVGLGKCELGNVTTSRFPMAWDYRFQIDHFCNRPDTQAFYIEQLMQEFWRTGGTPQTWIRVHYPGWGQRLVRLYLDGDIESLTPEEPEEGKNVEFRTSFTAVLEGFDVDLRYEIYPAMWELVYGQSTINPETLKKSFILFGSDDVRLKDNNSTLNSRRNVPPDDQCQIELREQLNENTKVISPAGYANANSFGKFAISTV